MWETLLASVIYAGSYQLNFFIILGKKVCKIEWAGTLNKQSSWHIMEGHWREEVPAQKVLKRKIKTNYIYNSVLPT